MAKPVPLDMLPAGLLPNTEEEDKKRKSNDVPADMLPDSLRAVPTDMLPDSLRPPAPAPELSRAPNITSGPNPFAAPEEKGFFARNIDYAADNLRSGWENLLSGIEGIKQSEAAEYATRLEEKYGPGAVNAPPDKQQIYKEAIQLKAQSEAERQRISAQQQQRYALNPQREATQELKAAITGFEKDELSFLDSAAKAGKALLSNPVGVIADLGLESTPASIAMLASAVLVRFGGGSTLAAAGTGGATSAVTEFGNEYASRIDKGIPHDKAWSDAAQKSGVIGLLDAVSMNSAGKAAGVIVDALTGTKRLSKAAAEVAKETGRQAALGAAGEAGGSLFIGEMPNPAAVIAEAAGEVFGAPMEAIGTYRSLKPTEKPKEYADTPEGRAMRGLDAIADEEEKARKAEFDAATADYKPTPAARTLDNLTQQEVEAVQRRLYAELGRPAEEQELLGAINEYLAEQNAGLGVESGAGVAGVSDTGTEQSTGTAGISDTGAAATSDTGGLGASGVSTDQLTDRTTEQPSTLDEAIDAFREADDVRQSALEELNKLRSAVEDLGYEEDQDGLNAMLTAAEARYEEARVAADVAYNNYEQFADRTIESTEGTPSQEDVDAAAPKSEEVLDEEALFEAQRQGDYQDAINAGYDELDQQEQGAQETPATDAETLATNYANELFEANPDYSVEEYDAAETRLFNDLKGQGLTDQAARDTASKVFSDRLLELDEGREGGGIFKSLSSTPSTYISPAVGIVPTNKFGINRLNKLYSDGKISAQEYADGMIKLYEELEDKAATKSMSRGLKKERGLGAVIKALEDAVKKGRISKETAEFAKWLLLQNPAIAADLAISIKIPQTVRAQEQNAGVAGFYNDMARLVRIITRKGEGGKYLATPSDVAVHEILHHMERMLPTELRALIREEWKVRVQKAMDKAVKENKLEIIKYLALVVNGNAAQSSGVMQEAENMIKDGKVPHSYYGLINTSEFWAVNGSNILAGRYGAETRLEKLRQYVKEFIEKIKSIFGLETDDPIIRGLNAVLKGDGTFLQKQMLADSRGGPRSPSLSPEGRTTADTEISEDEKKLQEQFRRAGDLQPDVVAAIQNNDLNGALNILANRLGGFYGELAAKLASLNLQTSIAFDNGNNLTYRAVEQIVGPQLQRVMNYMRVADPDYYDNWFKDFDRPENLIRLRTGINTLYFDTVIAKGKGKHSFTAISNEIKDVSDAIYKYDVTGAAGAYYNLFDAISLNTKRMEGMGNRVFLHEVVHAATVSILRADPSQLTKEQLEAREEIEKLYRLAQRNIKVGEYGLTNKFEFLAELFTNEEFQKLLKAIPYPAARTNVLSRFFSAVLRLVGADNLASRAMVEAEKLFTPVRYQETKPIGPLFAQGKKPKKPRGKGPITGGFRTNESLKERVLASRPEWKDSLAIVRDKIWDPTMAFGRGIKLGAVELRHLSDMAGTKFPLIGASVRIIEKMISHRGRIMTDAAAIAKDWMAAQKKNPAKSKLLGRVMLEATLSRVEVDPSSARYDAAKVDQRVKDAWNTLGPEFQGIYRRVRDFYQKQIQDAIQIMRDRANLIVDPVQRQKMLDNIDRDFGPDKLIYPYFPLKRFGPHWFQVGPAKKGSNYKEFYTFESMGERNTALRQRKKDLLAGNAAQRDLAENHIEVGDNISTLLAQVSDVSNVLKTVNELVDSLPDKFNNLQSQEAVKDTILDVQEELRDDINQLIYSLMPEQSMRKQMISRKSVQGASEDMLRVFTNSATRIAYQQARAKYSPQYIANLNNARSFIKDMKGVTTPEQRRVYRDFLHEMERRYKPMLGMEDTSSSAKVAGVISDAVTFFMMSAPMSAFLNTIGYFQFTATQLGGRYGYAKATEQMIKNFSTYMGSSVDRTLMPLKNGQMLSVHFPSAMESGKLTGLDKVAAQQLMDEEQVNVSQTYDMVSVGDRPSDLTLSKYEAVKRAVFMPLHQIERFNREIGLLTTFQLEYEKLMSNPIRDSSGVIVRDAQGNPETYQNDATTPDGVPYSTEAYDRALTQAKDLAAITLGETTRQMRPRYFMNALLALPLKFKRYMITALYSMWSNFDKGFMEPFKTAEIEQMRKVLEANKESPDAIDRKIAEMEEFRAELSKEGRRALAGAMFNTFLVGGTAALPFYTTIFPLIIGMFISDDDDDEFFDFDNWYRNYMEYEFGGFMSGLFVAGGMDPATAKKLGRGIGEAAVVGPTTKLTGGSLSERVSLDIKSMAFRDMRYTPSARNAMLEAIAMVVGPAAGLALAESEAYELAKQGQYGRAFERGAPAILGKPVTAARYAMEGAKTKRGDELVDDVTGTEIALQAIGLAPYRVTKAQKQSIAAVQKVQKIEHKRTDIMNDLWMAYSGGDTKEFEAAHIKALEFSDKYPTYRITNQNITDSLNKRMEDQLLANELGARVDMKALPIVLPMLKYGRE